MCKKLKSSSINGTSVSSWCIWCFVLFMGNNAIAYFIRLKNIPLFTPFTGRSPHESWNERKSFEHSLRKKNTNTAMNLLMEIFFSFLPIIKRIKAPKCFASAQLININSRKLPTPITSGRCQLHMFTYFLFLTHWQQTIQLSGRPNHLRHICANVSWAEIVLFKSSIAKPNFLSEFIKIIVYK